MELKDFDIQISGLKNQETHKFSVDFDKSIYDLMPDTEIEPLDFKAKAKLEIYKEQTKLQCTLTVTAQVQLTCDYTDKPYKHELVNSFDWLIKFGNEDNFEDDEIWVVSLDQYSINIFDVVKDTFFLGIPSERRHPELRDEDIDRYYDQLSETAPQEAESDFGKLLKESMKKR